MERFVEPSAAKFQGKMAFVEKDVDHSPDLIRQFRVFGTPTFVLLDAKGLEVARFGFERTPERFEAQLTKALGG